MEVEHISYVGCDIGAKLHISQVDRSA